MLLTGRTPRGSFLAIDIVFEEPTQRPSEYIKIFQLLLFLAITSNSYPRVLFLAIYHAHQPHCLSHFSIYHKPRIGRILSPYMVHTYNIYMYGCLPMPALNNSAPTSTQILSHRWPASIPRNSQRDFQRLSTLLLSKFASREVAAVDRPFDPSTRHGSH